MPSKSKNKMIRTIVLFILMSTLGYSQDSTLILKYSYEVIENGEKKQKAERTGFLNAFSPIMIWFLEKSEDLSIEVRIKKDTIFTQSKIKETNEISSTKYQIENIVFYQNLLTGEEKTFQYEKFWSSENKLNNKLKLKNKIVVNDNGCELATYTAKDRQKTITLNICNNIRIDQQFGLFREYFFNNKLIAEKKIIDKEKKTESILKLISIDTSYNSNSVLSAIEKNQELVIANNELPKASLKIGETVKDVYYKNVEEGKRQSLTQYKGNGKYLMLDFWGTWCKPCLASIPELIKFYDKYSDKIDLISMNYRDSNFNHVKAKIEETGMYWPQGIATVKINEYLNPDSFFPGIILLDDEMKLIVRNTGNDALEEVKTILDN